MRYRKTIREAYEQIEPTHEQKERMLDNIFAAADQSASAGKDVTMKRFARKPMLIAASLILAILMVGCAAVLLGLDDLMIDEYSYTQPAWINADGERIEETQITKSVISLQGIAGSSNQMAAQEWYEFSQNYDTDRKILQVSDDFRAPDAYQAYFVYSQEMVEKVDEIAEKYGLQLAGRQALVQDWAKDIFFESLGIESLFTDEASAEMGFGAGYFYECGNFKMEFECTPQNPEFQWEHPLFLTLNYREKDYLDTVFMHLNVENAQQQTLKLFDGTEVLVVQVQDSQSGDSVHVFCDREDAFVYLRMDIHYFNSDGTVDVMGQEDIARAINLIDFSVKPQKPDMAVALKKLEAADKQYQEEMEARMAAMGDPFRVDSYQALTGMFENGTYYLADLNGDGQQECFLWAEDGYGEVFTIIDGITEQILSAGGIYLCEDSVVGFYEEVGEAYYVHGYLKMEGNEMVWLDRLVYDRANEQWSRSTDGIRAEENITEEEAERILSSYTQLEIQKKPVSELQ